METIRSPRRDARHRDKDDDRPAIWVGYGRLVKLFRERAGLTQQQLADAIGYSCELVASVERARRPAKAAFTTAAERVLEAGGALQTLQEQVDLAKLPAFFQDFAVIEAEAVSRFSYDPLLVPGLLQTEEYARTLFSGRCPQLNEETVEQLVEARLNRQRLLTRTPIVELHFIIGESVLRSTAVGGQDVLRLQLEQLLRLGDLRNVAIQVMPADSDLHPGFDGPMVLLETMEHRRVGYVESQGAGIVLTDPAKVSAFGLRYGKLRSQALNVSESARLIEALAGET